MYPLPDLGDEKAAKVCLNQFSKFPSSEVLALDQVVKWIAKEGDKVKPSSPLCILETEHMVIDLDRYVCVTDLRFNFYVVQSEGASQSFAPRRKVE